MIWGVGFGDVVTGAELAYQIYNYGFNEENAADERYMIFQNQISILHSLLRKLEEALKEAHKRYETRDLHLRINAYDPVSDDFETERRQLVGDFRATLRECDVLLQENEKYRTKFANFGENLKWHLSQQEQRVDWLRQRLHFHCEKIRFVIDRLSINLLTDIDSKVDDILAVTQQTLQNSDAILLELAKFRLTLFRHLAGHGDLVVPEETDPHSIGELVARRFRSCLNEDTPSSIERAIPLIEGFDALLLHFDRSNDGSVPSAEKYLAFLKTKWLLGEIKASHEFKAARPGLYYKRAVNQIEQAILTKPRQSDDLIPYEESVLLGLPEHSYRVWPLPTPLETAECVPPHPLMAAAHEEQVLCLESEIPGSSTASSITVFRSSPRQFRIVQQTMGIGLPGSATQLVPYLKESPPILCDLDKLIPRYAQPTITAPDPELVISARGWEMPYRFASMEQLYRFQGALMGYTVSHSQERIIFEFDDVKGFGDRKGRAQLWQEPIVLGTSPRNQLQTLPRHSTAASFPTSAPLSRHDSGVPSLVPSTTINETVDGWEAESIKSSALVIFTQAFDRRRKNCPFATLFFDLEPGIFIDHNECGCPRVPMEQSCTCMHIVLTKKVKHDLREYVVRVGYSEVDSQGQPNVNAFDLFPFRVPRHPGFERLVVKRTKYFALKFPTLSEKREFHDELINRIRVRERQIKNQRDFDRSLIQIENQQRRDGRTDNDKEKEKAPNPVVRTSFSTISPPRLDLGGSGVDFAEAMARHLDPFHISSPLQLEESETTTAPQSSQNLGAGRYARASETDNSAHLPLGSAWPSAPTNTGQLYSSRENVAGGRENPFRSKSNKNACGPEESVRRTIWPRRRAKG